MASGLLALLLVLQRDYVFSFNPLFNLARCVANVLTLQGRPGRNASENREGGRERGKAHRVLFALRASPFPFWGPRFISQDAGRHPYICRPGARTGNSAATETPVD